jgi:hypothetical protein
MKLLLNFDKIQPMSINKAYYKTRKVLTQAARDYRKSIWEQMEPHRQEIDEFKSNFDKFKHSLSLKVYVGVPSSRFYTQQGYISLHSSDIDNIAKLLIDNTVDPKFRAEKYAAPTLDIDDKFITALFLSKYASPEEHWHIEMEFEIIDL